MLNFLKESVDYRKAILRHLWYRPLGDDRMMESNKGDIYNRVVYETSLDDYGLLIPYIVNKLDMNKVASKVDMDKLDDVKFSWIAKKDTIILNQIRVLILAGGLLYLNKYGTVDYTDFLLGVMAGSTVITAAVLVAVKTRFMKARKVLKGSK